MKKRFILLIISILTAASSLMAQGPGGPTALQNAFAGPSDPPGGGGGGGPIGVPLDSDALIFLLFAGIVYLLYHYRKYFTQKETSDNSGIPDGQSIISN